MVRMAQWVQSCEKDLLAWAVRTGLEWLFVRQVRTSGAMCGDDRRRTGGGGAESSEVCALDRVPAAGARY
jgi:hypothetical protein